MKIIVFGATGKTGEHVCRLAVEQGHEVTAFTRSAGKVDTSTQNLRVAMGDVMDCTAVAAAVGGQNTAIVVLGSNGLRDKTTLAAGTRNIVDGMTQKGTKRLIVLSAAGVGDSWGQIPLLAKVMFKTMLRNVYADHTEQEAVVKGSGLDWTIVRAAILKDDPASGKYTVGNSGKVGQINRADVAAFLVEQVDGSGYSEQAVSVTS